MKKILAIAVIGLLSASCASPKGQTKGIRKIVIGGDDFGLVNCDNGSAKWNDYSISAARMYGNDEWVSGQWYTKEEIVKYTGKFNYQAITGFDKTCVYTLDAVSDAIESGKTPDGTQMTSEQVEALKLLGAARQRLDEELDRENREEVSNAPIDSPPTPERGSAFPSKRDNFVWMGQKLNSSIKDGVYEYFDYVVYIKDSVVIRDLSQKEDGGRPDIGLTSEKEWSEWANSSLNVVRYSADPNSGSPFIMREHVTNSAPVPLIWQKNLPSNLVEGVRNSSSASPSAGTLGRCPNRGARCYLETSGIDGYQKGEDRYFPGGVPEARRDCMWRGGVYVEADSEFNTLDYCSIDNDIDVLDVQKMNPNIVVFGTVMGSGLQDGIYESSEGDVVHLKDGAVIEDLSEVYGCFGEKCKDELQRYDSVNRYGTPANLDVPCRGYVIMKHIKLPIKNNTRCLHRTYDLP